MAIERTLTAEKKGLTDEQRKCDEETGHDFEWFAPEDDVGFNGYGQCNTCGLTVPYEDPGLEDDYGC